MSEGGGGEPGFWDKTLEELKRKGGKKLSVGKEEQQVKEGDDRKALIKGLLYQYEGAIRLPSFPDTDVDRVITKKSKFFGRGPKDEEWIRFSCDYFARLENLEVLIRYWKSLLKFNIVEWGAVLMGEFRRKSGMPSGFSECEFANSVHDSEPQCFKLNPYDPSNGNHFCYCYWLKVNVACRRTYCFLMAYFLKAHYCKNLTKDVRLEEKGSKIRGTYVPVVETNMRVHLTPFLSNLWLLCRSVRNTPYVPAAFFHHMKKDKSIISFACSKRLNLLTSPKGLYNNLIVSGEDEEEGGEGTVEKGTKFGRKTYFSPTVSTPDLVEYRESPMSKVDQQAEGIFRRSNLINGSKSAFEYVHLFLDRISDILSGVRACETLSATSRFRLSDSKSLLDVQKYVETLNSASIISSMVSSFKEIKPPERIVGPDPLKEFQEEEEGETSLKEDDLRLYVPEGEVNPTPGLVVDYSMWVSDMEEETDENFELSSIGGDEKESNSELIEPSEEQYEEEEKKEEEEQPVQTPPEDKKDEPEVVIEDDEEEELLETPKSTSIKSRMQKLMEDTRKLRIAHLDIDEFQQVTELELKNNKTLETEQYSMPSDDHTKNKSARETLCEKDVETQQTVELSALEVVKEYETTERKEQPEDPSTGGGVKSTNILEDFASGVLGELTKNKEVIRPNIHYLQKCTFWIDELLYAQRMHTKFPKIRLWGKKDSLTLKTLDMMIAGGKRTGFSSTNNEFVGENKLENSLFDSIKDLKQRFYVSVKSVLKLWAFVKLKEANPLLRDDVGKTYVNSLLSQSELRWYDYEGWAVKKSYVQKASKNHLGMMKKIRSEKDHSDVSEFSGCDLDTIFRSCRTDETMRGFSDWIRLMLCATFLSGAIKEFQSPNSPYILHLGQSRASHHFFEKRADEYPFMYYSGGRYQVFYAGNVWYKNKVSEDWVSWIKSNVDPRQYDEIFDLESSSTASTEKKAEALREYIRDTIEKEVNAKRIQNDSHSYCLSSVHDDSELARFSKNTLKKLREEESYFKLRVPDEETPQEDIPEEDPLDLLFGMGEEEMRKWDEKVSFRFKDDGDSLYDTMTVWIMLMFDHSKDRITVRGMKEMMILSCEKLASKIESSFPTLSECIPAIKATEHVIRSYGSYF